jgi:hypothetical protein
MGKYKGASAEEIQKASLEGLVAAKDAMIEAIEKALPEDDRDGEGYDHFGALITATTMIYADMLRSVVELHSGYDCKKQASLIVGLTKSVLAEPLMKVARIADGID